MTRGRNASPRSVLIAGVALALAVVSAGCESEPPGKPVRLPKNYDGRFADTINYESFGTTSEVNCGDGKSLTVAGSNNRLKVRGRCESVTVLGADNRITVERVDKSLTLSGLNNSVTYRGGDPTVDDRGSGNTITDRR